jgi:very-short-patch-repair endonuclease
VPQLWINTDGLNYYLDLGDDETRLIAEADSFAFHGSPEALARDCRRSNELTRRGWTVLRFSHDQTIFDDTWVQQMMIDTHRSLVRRRRRG